MTTVSPHQYREQARLLGLSAETIDNALAQAREVERRGFLPILSLKHLAHLTGAPYGYLRSIVSRGHDGYKPFVIRKRSGGQRLIAAPEPILLEVQRWISKNILARHTVHTASMAYAPKSSPRACAERHLGARWLIKLDIHDFFESISERRAYFAFRSCGYQALVAFELARICTRVHPAYNPPPRNWHTSRRSLGTIAAYAHPEIGHLPQGAPTSPMLSNIISFRLDEMLEEVARQHQLVYTRYSDDICFSSGDTLERRTIRTIVHDGARILRSFEHRLHRKKVTIVPPGARKLVLGLLVDGNDVKLSRTYKSRIETHIRGIEKFGIIEHAAARKFTSIWGLIHHVSGLISHAQAVEHDYGVEQKRRFSEVLGATGWPAFSSGSDPI